MCDWIAKDAQANRGIGAARNLTPLLKISECVALGGLLLVLHVIPNGVRDLTQANGTLLVLCVIQSS
jgi:hypothetical protein